MNLKGKPFSKKIGQVLWYFGYFIYGYHVAIHAVCLYFEGFITQYITCKA